MKNPYDYKTYGPRKSHSGLLLIVLLFWVAILGILAYNRQGLYDAWRLHNYQAPTDVAALSTDDTMTDSARRVFYVNEPAITDKTAFTDNCPSGTERSVVLGCYHGSQNGIYVLKVTDPRLNGVEQVTAAHELLHAEYDRLSDSKKKSVDTMLQSYYDTGLTDDVIKAQIADYRQTEPNDVLNEMHSLFGTEVAQLPSGLEQYYKQYFSNRPAIAGFYAQYQAEFTDRQNKIKAYDGQLSNMRTEIEADEKSLSTQNASLDSKRSLLDSLRASGDIAGYNAQVPIYNAAVESYNRGAQSVRQLISSFNALVQTRNALAAETNQLTSEISNQVPSASQ